MWPLVSCSSASKIGKIPIFPNFYSVSKIFSELDKKSKHGEIFYPKFEFLCFFILKEKNPRIKNKKSTYE
jgi:hypothetical protein